MVGCQSKKEEEQETIYFPTIMYQNKTYTSGYDDSNLLDKLPRGFKEVSQVKGVEDDPSLSPTKEGYASQQAAQIRGVREGTIIYGSKKAPDYILTEDHEKYVVYSSNKMEDVNFSDFIKGITIQTMDTEETLEGYEEIVASSITQKELEVYEASSERLLIHNNGKQIKNDLLEENVNEGNFLLAISLFEENGISYETTYFGRKELSEKELVSYMEGAEDELLEIEDLVRQKGDIIKRYYWEFQEEEQKQATLAAEVVFRRLGTATTLRTGDGSVWLVQIGGHLKKINASHIQSQELTMQTDYNKQELLQAGQLGEAERTILREYELLEYPTEENGFRVEEKSNLSNGYGKWHWIRRLREDEEINSNPSIRLANTEGDLELNLQYIVEMTAKTSSIFNEITKYNTGKVKILIPDH